MIGLLIGVYDFAELFAKPLAGFLADRVAVRATVVVGLLLAALGIMAVTFTIGIPLIVIVVLTGIGIGTVWTNSDTLVSQLAQESQLGASIGAAQSFKEFGDMIGPLLVGLLTQFFGVRIGFITSGALALLLVVALLGSGRLTTSS